MAIRELLDAFGLMALATVNVGVWTLRVSLAAAGRRIAAALVSGVEAVIFALVFGAVVTALDDPLRVVGYAAGVAAGTLLGIVVNAWLTPGQALVTVVVDGDGSREVAALHHHGWPVTATHGTGVCGPVTVLTVAVHDQSLRGVAR